MPRLCARLCDWTAVAEATKWDLDTNTAGFKRGKLRDRRTARPPAGARQHTCSRQATRRPPRLLEKRIASRNWLALLSRRRFTRRGTRYVSDLPDDYHKAYFGKWHLGDEIGKRRGFDEWHPIEDGYRVWSNDPEIADEFSPYHHYLISQGYEPDAEVGGLRVFSRPFAHDPLRSTPRRRT